MMIHDKFTFIQHYLANHPEDASSVLIKYSAKEVSELIQKTEQKKIIPVINLLPAYLLSEVLKEMSFEKSITLFNFMNPNLAARILRKWMLEKRLEQVQEVFAAVETSVKSSLEKISSYDEGTVGAIMNPVPFAISPDLTIKETLAVLAKEKNRYSRYIYVVDMEKKLLGVIPFKDVFYSGSKEELISKSMSKEVFSVKPGMRIEILYENRVWSKWDSLPVVNSAKELLGVVKFEVLEEYIPSSPHKAKDDQLKQAGDAIADIIKIGLKSAVNISSEIFNSRKQR